MYRAFVVAVIAIALATVAGLAVLWPSGDAPPLRFAEGTQPGETYRAEVTKVTSFECGVPTAPGGEAGVCKKISFELAEGPDEGRTASADVGAVAGTPDFSVGDDLRVSRNRLLTGSEYQGPPSYSILDFERKMPLLWLTVIFAALVIVFGRLRGAMSLAGLAISLVIVLVFVVPALLRDSSPLAVALVGSLAVMLTTIPLAHGVGPKSLAAMVGTGLSLALVVGLAVLFTHLAHLTGVSSDDSALLAANAGDISFQGLLIAGMVIGSLGVLDDVTISQASTVMALRGANARLRLGDLYRRAIEVGRDHVSATVNTLVLAYVGSSLTTLLIFGSGQLGFFDAVNLEVVAAVIVGTLVGSIGLICAVPITTILAAFLADDLPPDELPAEQHAGHAH